MQSLLLISLALLGCTRGDGDTGSPDPSTVDADGDGVTADIDCDDADASVTNESTFYADADADGFGDASASQDACAAPEGFVEDATDCDDASADVNPEASEVCNDVDDDCDGLTDDDDDSIDASTQQDWFADADADGFGDADAAQTTCAAPDGYVSDDTDCDDASADVNPDAEEVCNEVDDDCDGTVDGESATDVATWYIDADGDGFGTANYTEISCVQPEGYVADSTDCNDLVAEAYPGNTEVCDGVDNDCSGQVDGDDATDRTTWYADADADGFGDDASTTVACDAPSGTVADGGDCDDGNAELNPTTIWYADSDADTYGDVSATQVQCAQPSGYVRDATDCNDGSDAAYPGGTEVCDALDNDCNGDTDGSDAQDQPTWYADADADTYGDAGTSQQQCAQPDGYVSNNTDCDDADAELNPLTEWFTDVDADGYGTGDAVVQCAISGDYARESGDCDDSLDDVFPGASQVCDDIDHDCDGDVDFDSDGDGLSAQSCGGGDCDDSNPNLTECGLTPESALQDCQALKAAGATEDGQYWIDPDDDGDTSNAFQVLCDMTTDGGGWTLTWAVDAEHFDGSFGNDTSVNPNAPTEYNEEQDVWNPPTDLPVSQVLYGCTNNSDQKSFWRYNTDESLDFWIGTTNYQYQEPFRSDATSSNFRGGCMAAHKGTASYGFMVIQEGDTSCGNCRDMLWGTYHYTGSRADCNNTDTSLGTHPSTVNGRNIGYPVCNKAQTSTGKFWIGVR